MVKTVVMQRGERSSVTRAALPYLEVEFDEPVLEDITLVRATGRLWRWSPDGSEERVFDPETLSVVAPRDLTRPARIHRRILPFVHPPNMAFPTNYRTSSHGVLALQNGHSATLHEDTGVEGFESSLDAVYAPDAQDLGRRQAAKVPVASVHPLATGFGILERLP